MSRARSLACCLVVLTAACSAPPSDPQPPRDAGVTEAAVPDGPTADGPRADGTAADVAAADGPPSDMFAGDGPTDAVADQGGESCPASYTNHCEGTVAKRCYKGELHTFDCAGSPNALCVEVADDVQCLVSSDTTKCAAGLPPCKDVAGQAHALSCVESPPGVLTSYYGRCATGFCKPEPSAPERGRCVGAPCAGEYRKCVGDDLHVCEEVNELMVYECATKGQVCVESSLGNGWAVCNAAGEQPCDPMTFVKTCASETKGVTCTPKLGYTVHFDCATVGKVCCFDIDAGPSSLGDNCCDAPTP